MNQPKVFLIAGKIHNGKSTFANALEYYYKTQKQKVLRIAFGDVLKFIATRYYNWDGEKNEVGRYLLQTLGTDKIRRIYPDFFARFAAELAKVMQTCDNYNIIICDDWRFPNEYDAFVNTFGLNSIITVKIERKNEKGQPWEDENTTSNAKNHASENNLHNYAFNYIIENRDYNDLTESARQLCNLTFNENCDII